MERAKAYPPAPHFETNEKGKAAREVGTPSLLLTKAGLEGLAQPCGYWDTVPGEVRTTLPRLLWAGCEGHAGQRICRTWRVEQAGAAWGSRLRRVSSFSFLQSWARCVQFQEGTISAGHPSLSLGDLDAAGHQHRSHPTLASARSPPGIPAVLALPLHIRLSFPIACVPPPHLQLHQRSQLPKPREAKPPVINPSCHPLTCFWF